LIIIRENDSQYRDISKGEDIMKQKGSIIKTVFGAIDAIVNTTEDIHQNIAGMREDTIKNSAGDRGNKANVYDRIKSVSGKVEEIVLSFFK
jgi:hypothetical protein